MKTVIFFALAYLCLIAVIAATNHKAHKRNFFTDLDG